MKYKKSKRKELRRRYENLYGKNYVNEIKKQPPVSWGEWVDLMNTLKEL